MNDSRALNIVIGIVFLFSLVSFGLGMYFPIMITGTKFILTWNSEPVTIFRTIGLFFDMEELLLGIIVLLFSVITPIVEYVAIGIRYFTGFSNVFLQQLDKWNMLDVFLVALLLLNYKMNSCFIVMSIGLGCMFVGLSVVFRIITIVLLDYKSKCLITK